jgi:hypothetical protein
MGWFSKILNGERGSRNADLGEMGFLPYGAFHRELKRQRAMRDRSGGNFTLVVFRDPGNGKDGSGHSKLAALIASRIRLSDIAGEYENGSKLGVILPDTDVKGAELFVAAMEDLLRREMNGRWRPESKLHCEVSVYPQPRAVVALAEGRAAETVSKI